MQNGPYHFIYLCKEGRLPPGKVESPSLQLCGQALSVSSSIKRKSISLATEDPLEMMNERETHSGALRKCDMECFVAILTQMKVFSHTQNPGYCQTGQYIKIQLHAIHKKPTLDINTQIGLKWEKI